MTEKKRILVIDDIRSHLLYMKWILSEDNYEVCIAEDLYEAYDTIKQIKVDLILLDLILPGVDGFEFLKTMSRSHELFNIPVIVVSVKSDFPSIEKALELGAKDYIVKPYNTRDVINKATLIIEEEIKQ